MPALSQVVFTPLRTNSTPAFFSSCHAAVPVGLSAVGGGGSVRPIGKTFRPFTLMIMFVSKPTCVTARVRDEMHREARQTSSTTKRLHGCTAMVNLRECCENLRGGIALR